MQFLSFILLFLCFSTTKAQDSLPIHLLPALNFDEGGYSLVMLSMKNYHGVDTSNHFYTQDIEQIKEVQKNLMGTRPATVYPFGCFESKVLNLCKDGVIIESIFFSANCRAVRSFNDVKKHNYGYHFEPFEMQNLVPSAHKLCQVRHQFKDRNTGQKYLDSIRQDKNLILVTPENWMQYEGKFGFFYKSQSYQNDEIKALLQETLQRTFPNENFTLECSNSGGSSETMFNFHAVVHCNKNLYDQFKLYPIDGNQWQAFPIVFDSYWK